MAARIRKNDIVEVVAGANRHRTVKRGRVVQVDRSGDKVVVEGVNMAKRHTRANPQKNIKGGILEREAPIHMSNVMPVCKACDKGVRVGYKILEDKSKVRVCRSCGVDMD